MKYFPCLKDIFYLEAQAKLIEGQSKIQRSASEFQIQR